MSRRYSQHPLEFNGHPVRSKFELQVCTDLVERKIPYEYEPDTLEIWVPVRGVKCGSCGTLGKAIKQAGYTIDIRLNTGRYIEIKGKLDVLARGRLKALYEGWGAKFERPLSLLLMRDNWLTKKHKHRYTDWAESVGYDVAVGTSIPTEWLH